MKKNGASSDAPEERKEVARGWVPMTMVPQADSCAFMLQTVPWDGGGAEHHKEKITCAAMHCLPSHPLWHGGKGGGGLRQNAIQQIHHANWECSV